MKTVSATDAKTRFGQYLEKVHSEPVQIQKKDRPVAVLISYEEYERFLALENSYWLAEAKKAEKSGYIGVKRSMKLLKAGLGEKS
jgi:prevent-host-death family protein